MCVSMSCALVKMCGNGKMIERECYQRVLTHVGVQI